MPSRPTHHSRLREISGTTETMRERTGEERGEDRERSEAGHAMIAAGAPALSTRERIVDAPLGVSPCVVDAPLGVSPCVSVCLGGATPAIAA